LTIHPRNDYNSFITVPTGQYNAFAFQGEQRLDDARKASLLKTMRVAHTLNNRLENDLEILSHDYQSKDEI